MAGLLIWSIPLFPVSPVVRRFSSAACCEAGVGDEVIGGGGAGGETGDVNEPRGRAIEGIAIGLGVGASGSCGAMADCGTPDMAMAR